MHLLQRPFQLSRQVRIVAFDTSSAADQDMVGAGDAEFRKRFTSEGPEAALHPISDDGVADLLGHGDAYAHRRIVIAARADEQNESGHGGALAAVGGKEIRALLDIN